MNFKKRVNGSWTDIPHYIHNTSTDTITTLPAVIYANDTTATVGLKGQMIQSSTPSPTSPVMPQGTGERTGNLWDDSSTISKGQSPLFYTANFGTPLPAGTYTFSAKVIGEEGVTACRVSFRKSNMGPIVASIIGVSSDRTSITVTLTEPCYAVYMYGSNDTTTLAAVTYQDIMLNTGSTALPHEPPGVKIPISSASTTTPVYLGEVESTRRIKKLVLTGEENILLYNVSTGNLFRVSLPVNRILDNFYGNGICSHYKAVLNTGERVNGTISGAKAASLQSSVDIVDDYSTIADFKSYLAAQYIAGTPVTVWYVLATPETAVVNEPLRKIGEYADTVSGITIPTIAGADTISVDTTLQPSEVTVNYKGWHPVQNVHERDNGAWT